MRFRIGIEMLELSDSTQIQDRKTICFKDMLCIYRIKFKGISNHFRRQNKEIILGNWIKKSKDQSFKDGRKLRKSNIQMIETANEGQYRVVIKNMNKIRGTSTKNQPEEKA